VQWDTSEHDWLEGRGEKLYLIKMIDDATSRLFCRFVRHDSTEENMRLLPKLFGAIRPAAGVLHRQSRVVRQHTEKQIRSCRAREKHRLRRSGTPSRNWASNKFPCIVHKPKAG
jgi:hypothetical protein